MCEEEIQFRFIDICNSDLNTEKINFKKIKFNDKDILTKSCCISYRWGVCPKWEINVNNEYTANITACHKENFVELFKYFKKEGIKYFWMDCISINQNSNEDKKLQISYIPVLFNKVGLVFSAMWLMIKPDELKNVKNIDNIYEFIEDEQSRVWLVSEVSSNINFYTSWKTDEIMVSHNRKSIKSKMYTFSTFFDLFISNNFKTKPKYGPILSSVLNEEIKIEEKIIPDIDKKLLSIASKTYHIKHKIDIIKIGYILKNTEATNQEDKLYAIMPLSGYIIPKGYVRNNIKDAFLGYIKWFLDKNIDNKIIFTFIISFFNMTIDIVGEHKSDIKDLALLTSGLNKFSSLYKVDKIPEIDNIDIIEDKIKIKINNIEKRNDNELILLRMSNKFVPIDKMKKEVIVLIDKKNETTRKTISKNKEITYIDDIYYFDYEIEEINNIKKDVIYIYPNRIFSKITINIYRCGHEIKNTSQNFNVSINYNKSKIICEKIKKDFRCKECINT